MHAKERRGQLQIKCKLLWLLPFPMPEKKRQVRRATGTNQVKLVKTNPQPIVLYNHTLRSGVADYVIFFTTLYDIIFR
jgi:hypothetical protein